MNNSVDSDKLEDSLIEITDDKISINRLLMKLSKSKKKVIIRILDPLWLLEFKRWNLITDSVDELEIQLPDLGNTCYQIQEQLNVNFDIAYELYNIYNELRQFNIVKICSNWIEWFSVCEYI